MTSAPAPERIDRSTSYFEDTLDPNALIARAEADLADVDFDTVVATGLSGTIAATLIAQAMGKHLLILRKPDDVSTHSSMREHGTLGNRWVFVDDFTASGTTRKRVREHVAQIVCQERDRRRDNAAFFRSLTAERVDPASVDAPLFETAYVGDYFYQTGYGPGFEPAPEPVTTTNDNEENLHD